MFSSDMDVWVKDTGEVNRARGKENHQEAITKTLETEGSTKGG